MVKKVREKEGGGKHPRRLRGLAFLLSVVMFITCCFPFTAQAKTKVNLLPNRWYGVATDGKTVISNYLDNFTEKSSNSDYIQKDLDFVQLRFYVTSDIPSDSDIIFSFVTFKRYASFDCYYILSSSSGGQSVSGNFYNVVGIYNEEDSLMYYTLPAINCDFDVDYSNKGDYYLIHELSNFSYLLPEHEDLALSFRCHSYECNYEKQSSSGLLNSIIDLIKGIWEKLVNLPSEIGSFITSLVDSIAGFFSNLIGNLGDWFSNIISNLGAWFASIGDWFSELGNNIREWFNSLGDRISGFFVEIYVNITDFLISLFKPSDDYFEKLQADLDQHMSDHLGAVYNVPKALLEHLKEIVTGLEAADGSHLIIHFPELAFKLNGERYSLFSGIDYDLLEPINSLDDPTTKSMVNVVILLMHGFIDLSLAIGSFRMIYKQIINKVGIEGGSDL